MNYQYATFGQRAVAFIVDSLLLFVLSAPFFLLLRGDNVTFNQATLLPRFIITIIYNTCFISHGGQTLGKKLVKIRVVTAGGYKVDGSKAFLREFLGKGVMGMFVIGYFWMLFDKRKQCWQDKMADTVVVKAT